MCVCERERDTHTHTQRDREGREREHVCASGKRESVCLSVCRHPLWLCVLTPLESCTLSIPAREERTAIAGTTIFKTWVRNTRTFKNFVEEITLPSLCRPGGSACADLHDKIRGGNCLDEGGGVELMAPRWSLPSRPCSGSDVGSAGPQRGQRAHGAADAARRAPHERARPHHRPGPVRRQGECAHFVSAVLVLSLNPSPPCLTASVPLPQLSPPPLPHPASTLPCAVSVPAPALALTPYTALPTPNQNHPISAPAPALAHTPALPRPTPPLALIPPALRSNSDDAKLACMQINSVDKLKHWFVPSCLAWWEPENQMHISHEIKVFDETKVRCDPSIFLALKCPCGSKSRCGHTQILLCVFPIAICLALAGLELQTAPKDRVLR